MPVYNFDLCCLKDKVECMASFLQQPKPWNAHKLFKDIMKVYQSTYLKQVLYSGTCMNIYTHFFPNV